MGLKPRVSTTQTTVRSKRALEVERLWNGKKYHRLISQLEKWLRVDPEWRDEVLWKLGWARLHEDFDGVKQATNELHEVLHDDPSRSSVVVFEKFAMTWGGKPATGELDAYIELIKASRTHERRKLGLRYALAAIEIDPGCVTAQYRVGIIARDAGEYEISVRAFSTILEQFPIRGIYAARITTLQNLNDHLAVLADVDTLLSLCPDEESYWRVRRGNVLVKLARYDEAERDLLRALELNPKSPTAFLVLGHLHRKRGHKDQMREAWRAASTIGCPSADRALDEYG